MVGCRLLLVPILSGGIASACTPEDFTALEQPGEWVAHADGRWRPLSVAGLRQAGFTPVPSAWSGVSSANTLSDSSLIQNQMRANGSGVTIGDVDGDQHPDIYLARLDGPSTLYRNLGDWRFEDITDASGVAAEGQFSTGVALVDVDGDRDLDLIRTSIDDGASLLLNDGNGKFSKAPDSGLLGDTGAMSIALADIDGDEDLDLYITNYKRRSVLDLYSPEEAAFPNTVERTESGFKVKDEFEPHFELVWQGDRVRRLEKAEPDNLYINDGSGRFRHVPFDSGAFFGEDGLPIENALPEWGLAARFGDLDGDGDPDLYVANDLQSPDRLWVNQGDGSFRELSSRALRTTSASSMATDFSDIDRDGDIDIFTLDMLSRSSRLRKTQDPVSRVQRVLPGEIRGVQQVTRNTLLLNRGDDSYAEIANYSGVEASDWSWSALFVDVDLDAYEDIIIANGHILDLMDADTQIQLRTTFLDDWRQAILLHEPLPLRNVAFRNGGDLKFEEVGVAWGLAGEPDISHGAALGDLDGDGDLDAVVNRLDKPALLLRNDSDAPRLAVRLSDLSPNTAGIGAHITVDIPGFPSQSKEISAGGGYLSSSEPLAVFAMGEATSGTIRVRWANGRLSHVSVDGSNRLYEVTAPIATNLDVVSSSESTLSSAEETFPWFVADTTFGPLHDEPVYDEVSRQPLLPSRLSQMGPQLAWHDLDSDGDPDFLMSAGSGGAPVLLRNDGKIFTRVALSGPIAPVDQTGVIPLPNGQGAVRVILGLSNYEAPSSEASTVPSIISVEWGTSAVSGMSIAPRVQGLVSGNESSVGPLAMADYDGDGWLDLFVGGRVIPGRYPTAATSRLFRGRRDGAFEPDLRDPDIQNIGLVVGAVFSDIDVDGDPDLVLALEWGSLRVLRNDRGRFRDATVELGLSDALSKWTAVSTGDFDADGRPDLIATSWGENTEYQATVAHPLEVYFDDVDRNGTIEVLEAQYDARIGASSPLIGFGRLSMALPSVMSRILNYAEYADADVGDALGIWPEGQAQVTGFAHTVFLNRGDHFESMPLPNETQWAPSLGLAVADANGDGFDDIFLAQNFFATDEDSPRYDSGRGIWLRGDGSGGLEVVPARESGVLAYGDQRGVSVADVDGDGRIDLAIGQNGAKTLLYRNVSARPGLRVRLVGPRSNPYAIGAAVRVLYTSSKGPVREIRAGSGTGSHDDPVQVLGLSNEPLGLEVRWPGGRTEVVQLQQGQRFVTVESNRNE